MGAIPLPAALDGQQVQRTISLDSALLYLLDGALTALADKNSYTQTGTLTVEQALAELEAMIEDYYSQ